MVRVIFKIFLYESQDMHIRPETKFLGDMEVIHAKGNTIAANIWSYFTMTLAHVIDAKSETIPCSARDVSTKLFLRGPYDYIGLQRQDNFFV